MHGIDMMQGQAPLRAELLGLGTALFEFSNSYGIQADLSITVKSASW